MYKFESAFVLNIAAAALSTNLHARVVILSNIQGTVPGLTHSIGTTDIDLTN